MSFSEDSNIPKPPEGHQWKEVRHDNTVTWVACWQDTITNEMVYVDLGFISKNQQDFRKFNRIVENSTSAAKDFDLDQPKTNSYPASTFQNQEYKMPKYVDEDSKDMEIPTSSGHSGPEN